MSWKYVLRTDGIESFYDAVKCARRIGYEFIAWNSDIWFIEEHNHHRTKLTVKDLL